MLSPCHGERHSTYERVQRKETTLNPRPLAVERPSDGRGEHQCLEHVLNDHACEWRTSAGRGRQEGGARLAGVIVADPALLQCFDEQHRQAGATDEDGVRDGEGQSVSREH